MTRAPSRPPPAGRWPLIRALLLAFLAVWLLLTLFPIYWQFITAFKSTGETNLTVPTFWPREWHPENFAAIFFERSNLNALIDSFLIATGNTLASLFLGSLAGYAFARFPRQAGGENLAFWILSNRMFPPVAVLIPLFLLFDSLPWGTDSRLSLIILYLIFNMPLATWLMMVFFRDAPRELEEAAYLDGYTPARAFIKVTLPLVLPGMISVAMLCWIFAWNEYLFANLFVGTEVRTFTIVIPTFSHGSQTLWNLQMAFSLIAMLPPVVMFIALRRYMVRGLSLGVVKG
ncbi:MAG: carbohydrate ABC transporter permease [Gammaproteobacteria bacterium]|nr:carbohydrate ABC transporter permease [Gammaproteobacteria bacterium]MDD9822447.1 carbohydrate ABC transporter permease [Gammaproteobacteria bacterium]MDD9854722.1 carbohydrate ABC transporter permease [Gammaproteobacteria bacterium]